MIEDIVKKEIFDKTINTHQHIVENLSLNLKNGLNLAGLQAESANQINNLLVTTEYIEKDVEFSRCNFSQVYFSGIDFNNDTFSNCSFSNCVFTNCRNLNLLVFENCDFWSSRFQGCFFFGKLFFNSCFLHQVLFVDTYLVDSVFYRSCFYPTIFQNKCNLIGGKFIAPCGEMEIRFINEKSITQIDNHTLIGDFDYSDLRFSKKISRIFSFEKRFVPTKNGYLSFETQLRKNDMPPWFSNCFLNRKKAETRSSSNFREKLFGFTSELVCGYGEKPFNTLFYAFIFIVAFALLYMFSGFSFGDNEIQYVLDFSKGISFWRVFVSDFLHSLNFSFFTFITAGIGTMRPNSILSQIFFYFELFFGVIFIAVFTSTLVRKMTR